MKFSSGLNHVASVPIDHGHRRAIPDFMTMRTLADVRKLIGHLPAATRQKETWILRRRSA
jgi:hypothetical protein